MPRNALFAGLIFDEFDHPLETAYVGDEPCYVVDEAGFRRHLASEPVDRQVLHQIASMMKGSEDLLSQQAAKMLGSDDPFSRAMIQNQLKNIEQQFDMLFEVGIPEEMRAYLGMTGFKVIIDLNGQVLRFEQPGTASGEDE
ncbi:MAG: hypothetical protein RBS68_00790 [Anaerolineales bacterium]|jgi:hypothetical protein|nr:hypothetical protein [Anaerolineales bacterium]